MRLILGDFDFAVTENGGAVCTAIPTGGKVQGAFTRRLRLCYLILMFTASVWLAPRLSVTVKVTV